MHPVSEDKVYPTRLTWEEKNSANYTLDLEKINNLQDSVRKLSEEMRERMAKTQGTEDEICKICGKKTNHYAGDPGEWPIRVYVPWIPCEPGRLWTYHQTCHAEEMQKVVGILKACRSVFAGLKMRLKHNVLCYALNPLKCVCGIVDVNTNDDLIKALLERFVSECEKPNGECPSCDDQHKPGCRLD